MALYQPTNIIPSSYTKGTIDVSDTMGISWQVNGNSSMTAFQIDFYKNDANSTFVTSTGKLPKTGETQAQYNLPFYGTDRFGRPQFFTWSPDKSWSSWSLNKLTNGNEYKYKITQFWEKEGEVYTITSNIGLRDYKLCFYIAGVGYILLNSPVLNAQNVVFYYSVSRKQLWYSYQTSIFHQLNSAISNIQPSSEWVNVGEAVDFGSDIVIQNSAVSFITRKKPTITIYKSNEQYSEEIDFSSNGSLATSIGFFKAVYAQLQNDPIRWIRWQVATATYNAQTEEWTIVDILEDTGDIYTPTLNFEFNGFFNGLQYAIRAIGESESGQECNSNPDTDGWIFFTINIEKPGEYSGDFTIQCLNKENATLLQWAGVEVIPPKVSPQGYKPQISHGSVTLNGKNGDTEYSVTWDEQVVVENGVNKTIPINFSAPWTAVWKGKAKTIANYVKNIEFNGAELSNYFRYIFSSTFSPNGRLLVVGGFSTTLRGRALTFNVEDNFTISDGEEIRINGLSPANPIQQTVFSPDGSLLLLIETASANSNVYIFSMLTGVPIYVNTFELQFVQSIAFSADGKYLIAVGGFVGRAALYTVNGVNFNLIEYIMKNNSLFTDSVLSVKFSPINSKIFVLGGGFDEKASVFKIEDNSGVDKSEWVSDILGAGGSKPLGNFPVERIDFSPNGQLLILGGDINYVSVFSVVEENVEWAYDIKSKGDVLFDQPVLCQSFSYDGKWLTLGGQFNGNVSLFRVDSGMSYYVGEPNYTAGYVGAVTTISYSPLNDGSFVIGGTSDELAGIVDLPKMLIEGTIMKINNSDVSISAENYLFTIVIDRITKSFQIPPLATIAALTVTSKSINAYFYNDTNYLEQLQIPLLYNQLDLYSISIYGGNIGATVYSVSIYQGDGSNVLSFYENPGFEPVWDSNDYKLYMTANFNGNLEGGTGTATGAGFRVYRQEIGKNVLTPIATVPSITTSVKDYGIVSRKAYKYSLYAYDINGAFMSSVENEKVVATCFKNYSLLVCDYDEDNDEYHVRKQYLFALNPTESGVGNNNSPTLNANFTRYPTRMPSTQNYASGTLSGLIGAIYTVPALIEQIGNYKYTAKPSTMDYFDNVDLEKELYDLSTAPYQLFLRDMKGRLRMIHTSGPITMTTNIKQKQQSISMSLPWVEIGDASDVTIIQTPDDYGWNNDNQVLDVQLDVDVTTGELSATYPFPYNGTKFYLTGVNKETLTAKTPLGVTPAQFELSEVAEQPDDGKLNATVKVNSEDN